MTITAEGEAETQETIIAPEDQKGDLANAEKLLKECSASRDALLVELQEGLASLRHVALECLEAATGDNKTLFLQMRKRILDTAGNAARQDRATLDRYVVWQMYERQVVHRFVADKNGRWQLPPGVRHPQDRPHNEEAT